MAAVDAVAAQDVLPTVNKLLLRKRMIAFGAPAAILLYFIYIFFAFDFMGLAERARMDNARILLSDFISHKTHVTRENRSGNIRIAIEGEAKGAYPAGMTPEWVTLAGDVTQITLLDGHGVTMTGTDRVSYSYPGYGVVEIAVVGGQVQLTTPDGQIPNWISASDTRVAITTDAGRLSMTRARTEVFRYSYGWELFWFTLDNPFYGKSFGELVALSVAGDRIDPAQSNFGNIVASVWNNQMWRHGDVLWAIFETILMAFLGTMSAALVALPLAFFAASNFSPFVAVRQVTRRLFDFVRGVDGLIWTIILSRAFGPGPLTGALAIAITDTGSFGKMFSEALENVDNKQIEGLASTGAKPALRYRFGVIPQIMPVLLSQVLYFLESNTRSATVIGAITGGGIGLLLTQAITTQKDWEEVSYYIILILLMVILMDTVSGWLRGRLIKGTDGGH
jgi:phosphonate transport system permease protein